VTLVWRSVTLFALCRYLFDQLDVQVWTMPPHSYQAGRHQLAAVSTQPAAAASHLLSEP
jgi:hypothetical protein